MYRYRLSTENPEGIVWSFDFEHEKKFSQAEFENIAQEAFVYALEKEAEEAKKEDRWVYVSCVDCDHIEKFMLEKGFVLPENYTAAYSFDPFSKAERESIKNPKLKEWVNKPITKKLPGYLSPNE